MTRNVEKPSGEDVHSIDQMASLTIRQRQVLKLRWITTVEAMVAAAATPEARAGLVQVLGGDSTSLDQLLGQARTMLGEDRYRELLAPCAGGATGALWEDPDRHPGAGRASEEGHG